VILLKECLLTVMGDAFRVLGSRECQNKSGESGFSVFLSPSIKLDIAANNTEPQLLSAECKALLAGAHQLIFSGLPLPSIDVETEGKKVEIFRTGVDSLGFCIKKSGIDVHEISLELMGTYYRAYDLLYMNKKIRFILCQDIELVFENLPLSAAISSDAALFAVVFFSCPRESIEAVLSKNGIFPPIPRLDVAVLLYKLFGGTGTVNRIKVDGFFADINSGMLSIPISRYVAK